MRPQLKFVSVQFDATVESVLVEFQIEMTDLKCDREVRNKF
jgi:hypothetical protein